MPKEISKIILKNSWLTAFIFAIIGIYISFAFNLTMNKDVWFWFFSSISQTFAALVALVSIFLISRLESYNTRIYDNYNLMRTLVKDYANQRGDFLSSDPSSSD
jgi:predicted membrane channel-forming protein YqfA (hemolysin III family)